MTNKTFKLTAIAAAIVAMTACGSDSKDSATAAKSLNEAMNSEAFNIASYAGMQASENIYGTWLAVSRGAGSESVVAADVTTGDQVELEATEESASLELIEVEAGVDDDSIRVSFPCDGGSETLYKVAENTYEMGGYADEGGYTSAFNEDGSCADDEEHCEKYTLTFSSSNVSAEMSGEERFDNDGTAYIYTEGGSDYGSEGDNDFNPDIFSDIGMEAGSSLEVIFEESHKGNETGGMVKLSDADSVKFNAGGMTYNGLLNKADAESTFEDAHTASCFSYEAEGDKEVVSTTVDGEEPIITTIIETDNDLRIGHSDNGGLEFSLGTENTVETGYSAKWQRLELESDSVNDRFSASEESFAGISTSSGAIFNMGDITLADGVLRVSGSVEQVYSYDMYGRVMYGNESLVNINITVDVNAVEEDVIPD
ncbi:MAG: hypothetical protein KAG18_00970 [Sinobacterium sp.]|nr:hypothetical protein [Sinobacterium sp.]